MYTFVHYCHKQIHLHSLFLSMAGCSGLASTMAFGGEDWRLHIAAGTRTPPLLSLLTNTFSTPSSGRPVDALKCRLSPEQTNTMVSIANGLALNLNRVLTFGHAVEIDQIDGNELVAGCVKEV